MTNPALGNIDPKSPGTGSQLFKWGTYNIRVLDTLVLPSAQQDEDVR